MVHIAESEKPLKLSFMPQKTFEAISESLSNYGDICLVLLPKVQQGTVNQSINQLDEFYQNISSSLKKTAVVITIGDVIDLVHVQLALNKKLKFHHWIAIEQNDAIYDEFNRKLPNKHFGALIHTKYKNSLDHVKTRIAYTYCPFCNKTTKDYGGKKHTYHESGTLISDVWKDIEFDYNNLDPLIQRFADLFGKEPYNEIKVFDLRDVSLNRNKIKMVGTYDPKYENHSIDVDQILCGDVIENLRQIPDNSIDFIFTDPPYNLKKKYSGYDDNIEIEDYFKWCDIWLYELARILKPGRTLAIVNIPLWSIRHFQFLETVLDFQDWIVWDALSFPVRMIMPAHYTVLCFSKGESRSLPGLVNQQGKDYEKYVTGAYNPMKPLLKNYCLRSNCIKKREINSINDKGILTNIWGDIHRLKHNSRRVDHPCQLPPTLLYRLITIYTKPDEVVLDCFEGSGTTSLCASQLGRKYIGIEKSDEYFKLILNRHIELKNGINPFDKKDRKLISKNSPVPRMPKIKYQVPKKTLQLEVKRISEILNHIPDREELAEYSKYPIEYYDEYFSSWGEVCAAARTTGMKEDLL